MIHLASSSIISINTRIVFQFAHSDPGSTDSPRLGLDEAPICWGSLRVWLVLTFSTSPEFRKPVNRPLVCSSSAVPAACLSIDTDIMICLSTVLLLVAAVQATKPSTIPIAHTRNGTIHGKHLPEYHQDLFLGIPYANAPRLANPEPLQTKFKEPLDASEYGPTCYGFGSNRLLNLTQSEDCLNLNIIRPAGIDSDEKLPVLLWIYGGGFSQGASADPMWNLTYVVDTAARHGKPIIAMSINYRLAFFGFPGGKEALDAGITNLGLKDQRHALQWVQENIAAFGGDPSKVTIWGESAGSASVAFHLISYGGKGGEGLFRAGIMVSGFETGIDPKVDASVLEAGYQNVVAEAGCSSANDTLACLREAPFDRLYPGVQTGSPTAFGTIIDGDFIQREPARELTAGRVTRVPIILGGNADEGLFVVNTLASSFGTIPNTTAELRSTIQLALPGLTNDTAKQLLELYPRGGDAPPYSLRPNFPWCRAMSKANLICGTQYRRMAGILGDYFLDAPRRYMAENWASLGLDAYAFRFTANPTSLPIVYWNNLGQSESISANF
jgi:carboxylesterase type B